MLYVILIGIIIFLLYKEYTYSKRVTAVILVYLTVLKLSYLRDKKGTISDLFTYERLASDNIYFREYDHLFRSLAKAWEIPYIKSSYGSYADGRAISEKVINKLDNAAKELDFALLAEKARAKISD